MLDLDDDEARKLASILGGMAYTPKALENVEMALGELVIEWYRVEPGSPAENKTIGDLQIRRNFGATVVSVVQDDGTTIVNPGPEAPIRPYATLVVVGERQQINLLREMLAVVEGG